MLIITPDALLSYAKENLNGETLRTLAQGKKFKVEVIDGQFWFTPEDTDEPLRHQLKYLTNFCDKFNVTNCFEKQTYDEGTWRGSYCLAIVAKYLAAIADGAETPLRSADRKKAPRA